MSSALLVASSLLLSPAPHHKVNSDPWDLKPTFTPGAKLQWTVSVEASIDGQDHTATFDLNEGTKAGDAAKGQPIQLEMANVMVDTNPQEGGSGDGIVNAQNVLQSEDEDDWRRTFSPLLFAYPLAPVSIGDSWKAEVTPTAKGAAKMSYEFTAKQVEQVDGIDALLVTSKLKEAGDDGVSADGSWWVAKDGKVLKFKLVAKNWFVKVAGHSFDATITGKMKLAAH